MRCTLLRVLRTICDLRGLALAIVLVFAAAQAQAAANWLPTGTTYWVDAEVGNDANDGLSESTPFATIQAAADAVSPGDTVNIRTGIYRETVAVPTSGASGKPIQFRAYNGEPVVLSGGDAVSGWTLSHGDVWTANVDWDANDLRENNTLFVDGVLAYEARLYAENDLLDIDDWGRLLQGDLEAERLTSPDLVGYGQDLWNGAKVTFHVNDWTIATRTVINYVSNAGRVKFTPAVGGINLKQQCGFYIHDTIEALDKPGEWYKDSTADLLYYQAEPGQDPNGQLIEFKRRGYGFDLRGRSHVEIQGLQFRGTTLQLDSANENNVYRGNVFYGFGKGNGNGFDRMGIHGTGNVFRDNEVYESFHTAIDVTGARNSIVNNYFHDIALQTGRMAIHSAGSTETLIARNTFRNLGRSVLDGYPVRSEIAHNLIEECGRISWDTAAFDSDGTNGNASYSIFHHNLLRYTNARGILEGFYGRNDNAVIHHNIFHDWTSGGQRPTLHASGLDFRQAYHNTVIGAIGPTGNTSARNAVQTRYNNNLQIDTVLMAALGVDTRGNVDYSAADFLDFQARDFRLVAGSDAIDAGIVLPEINDGFRGAAPDAGAIESGSAMWAVGHDFASPPTPTYDWKPLPGTNIFTNGSFSAGISDWAVTSGSATVQDYNSWNMGPNSLTGTFRTKSVELPPGTEIAHTFTGLQPSTTYTLGSVSRLITEVTVGAEYDAASGAVTTGNVRDVDYVTGVSDGGWVSYDNIPFGFGIYDTIELLPNVGLEGLSLEGVRVQVRLNSPTGTVLLDHSDLCPVVDKVSRTWKRHVRSTFTPVSGVHSLYVLVTGSSSSNLAIGNIRLLASQPIESDMLRLLVTKGTAPLLAPGGSATTGAVPGVGPIRAPDRQMLVGAPDWQEVYETLVLTTGPNDTSLEVRFANDGRIHAYLDRLFLTDGKIEFGNVNLAETDGVASQASTAPGFPANAASDGDEATFSRTQDGIATWWQVSFPQLVNPGRIELVSPSDAAPGELGNFVVSVWESDPAAGGQPVWQQSYFAAGGVVPGGTFTIPGGELGADGETRLGSALGQVVRVHLNGLNNAGTGVLALAEVRILAGQDVETPTNVARNGVAEQSSDNTTQSDRGPHRALDGYINPYDGFTSTLADGEDWWQVDLGQSPVIDQIRLFNRGGPVGERLKNFRLSVWDGDPNSPQSTELWGKEYPEVVPWGGSLAVNGDVLGDSGQRLDTVTNGSFVRVQLNTTNFLSLIEAQVWTQ